MTDVSPPPKAPEPAPVLKKPMTLAVVAMPLPT